MTSAAADVISVPSVTLAPYEYGSILECVFNKLIIQISELENWSQQ